MSQTVETYPILYSSVKEESFKKFLDFDPDEGDLQNLISSSFLFKVYKIFMNIWRVILREVANRQTHKYKKRKWNAD